MNTPISKLTALMALATLITMTACSPKPSAEETAAQNKALVEQAVEATKKEMLAEQAAEKAKQDAVDAARAEEKNRQAADRAAARSKSRHSASAAQRDSTPAPVQKTVCSNCGVVLSINLVETSGKGSGLGVIAGGVVGGLLGNQVGKGTGKDVATIAGVVGGAVAGNAIEKHAKKTTGYDITIRMDSGEQRVIHQATAPNVASGDAVKIENDVIYKL